MRNSLIKHALVVSGLFAAAICQPQAAKAQDITRSVAQPSSSSIEIGPAARSAGVDEAVSLGKKKKHRDIDLTLSSADKSNGISGFVEYKSTGVRINFESRWAYDQLVSQIKNSEGQALIEYIEAQQEVVYEPGAPASMEFVPWLRVNGVEYKGYEGPVIDEMKALASSEEAELIRYLAFYLIFRAPDKNLAPERRGLEVAYQSIQKFYEKSYRRAAPGELNRSDLEAFRPKHAGTGSELTLAPDDCKMPDCKFVDTHDYQLTEAGGFAIKSLSVRLTLSHNYAKPEMPHREEEEGKIRLLDDASQVDDCFGRCGPGCGGWSHEWITGPNIVVDYTYCEDVSGGGFGGWGIPLDCSTMCCSQEHRVVSEAGIALHITSGHVTPGAIVHDTCCRNLFLGCLNPVCIAVMPIAADCFIPGLGWDETWSYVGPHGSGFDYMTGTCCVNVGPVN